MENLAPKPKKKGIMRSIKDALVGEETKQETPFVGFPREVEKTDEEFVENAEKSIEEFVTPAPIEKPKVPVKIWVRQEPVLVDTDPTVSTTVQMLLDENKVLAEQHAKNQHAIQMLTKGVLKYYEINTPNLAAVKFRQTEGVGQFVVPQPDKLIEK